MILSGGYEDDGPEYNDVLDLVVFQVSGVSNTGDCSLPSAVQHIARRERKIAQLLPASAILFIPAVLSDCHNRLLFHG